MAETQEFSTIQNVDLREVWSNEATDFTPWLAENITKLGDTLGLELELQSREAPVGSYSLDLLVHDLGRDRPVIIENQLEATNHTHLGQLLTYASGYDAHVAVWIAKEFKDEHRQALDWLNQRSDENTEFFGVVIEIWKIDDSRPAPHFKLVATPNNWRKGKVTTKQERATSRGIPRLLPRPHRQTEGGASIHRGKKRTASKLVFFCFRIFRCHLRSQFHPGGKSEG